MIFTLKKIFMTFIKNPKEVLFCLILVMFALSNFFILKKIEACNLYAAQQSVSIHNLMLQVCSLEKQMDSRVFPILPKEETKSIVNQTVESSSLNDETIVYVIIFVAVALLVCYFGFYYSSPVSSSYQDTVGTSEELAVAASKVAPSVNESTGVGSDVGNGSEASVTDFTTSDATSVNEITGVGSEVVIRASRALTRVGNGSEASVTDFTTSDATSVNEITGVGSEVVIRASDALTRVGNGSEASVTDFTTSEQTTDVFFDFAQATPESILSYIFDGLEASVMAYMTSRQTIGVVFDIEESTPESIISYIFNVLELKSHGYLVSPGILSNSLVISNPQDIVFMTHKFILPDSFESYVAKSIMIDDSLLKYDPALVEIIRRIIVENDTQVLLNLFLNV